MDLISSIASHLDIDGPKAEGLAGSILGGVQEAVAGQFGDDSAKELQQAVPELDGWKQAATSLLGGGGQTAAPEGGLGGMLSGLGGDAGGSGLLGAAVGALGGGGEMAGVLQLLGKLDIDSSKIGPIIQLVLGFLTERTDGNLLSKITAAVPLLTGGGDAGGDALSGGVGKALDSLF